MKLLNSLDKSDPQTWRNHNSRGKIVPANDDNGDRDTTPILMSPDAPRGKKRGLKNSFFITNALYQNDVSGNKSPHQNEMGPYRSPRIQDVQNSYFATSDRN